MKRLIRKAESSINVERIIDTINYKLQQYDKTYFLDNVTFEVVEDDYSSYIEFNFEYGGTYGDLKQFEEIVNKTLDELKNNHIIKNYSGHHNDSEQDPGGSGARRYWSYEINYQYKGDVNSLAEEIVLDKDFFNTYFRDSNDKFEDFLIVNEIDQEDCIWEIEDFDKHKFINNIYDYIYKKYGDINDSSKFYKFLKDNIDIICDNAKKCINPGSYNNSILNNYFYHVDYNKIKWGTK